MQKTDPKRQTGLLNERLALLDQKDISIFPTRSFVLSPETLSGGILSYPILWQCISKRRRKKEGCILLYHSTSSSLLSHWIHLTGNKVVAITQKDSPLPATQQFVGWSISLDFEPLPANVYLWLNEHNTDCFNSHEQHSTRSSYE